MRYSAALFRRIRLATVLLAIAACGSTLSAQAVRPGILRGQVTDISGGSVEGATVLLTTPTGQTLGEPPMRWEHSRFPNSRLGTTTWR